VLKIVMCLKTRKIVMCLKTHLHKVVLPVCKKIVMGLESAYIDVRDGMGARVGGFCWDGFYIGLFLEMKNLRGGDGDMPILSRTASLKPRSVRGSATECHSFEPKRGLRKQQVVKSMLKA
jgi:hypothetical protein